MFKTAYLNILVLLICLQPERIDPSGDPSTYDIRSDVWSLGISLIELATGKFPYSSWLSPFEQLKQVVKDAPPRLPPDTRFSSDFRNFVDLWFVIFFDNFQNKDITGLLPKVSCLFFFFESSLNINAVKNHVSEFPRVEWFNFTKQSSVIIDSSVDPFLIFD